MKKYLVRVIGALCILAATALLFLPTWLELDGASKKELRYVREDITAIIDITSEAFLESLDDDDFKDDLKDNDLPYTRNTIKKEFKSMNNLTKDLLDNSVSMKELLVLSAKAPGALKTLKGMMELEVADDIFFSAAKYALVLGNDRMDDASLVDILDKADQLEDQMDVLTESADTLGLVCYALMGVLGLLLLLAVLSAITHVCNKGRGLKYLLLVIMILLVVGSMVAIPMVNDLLGEAMESTPVLRDLSLEVQYTPILAVVLMFVPIVLDIIFERKNKQIKMEA